MLTSIVFMVCLINCAYVATDVGLHVDLTSYPDETRRKAAVEFSYKKIIFNE